MANFLIRLGYDAVAYNVSASAPLTQQHRCNVCVFVRTQQEGCDSQKEVRR